MNVYAIKMAGVSMISTSTISLRARIAPRWTAFLGYALALFLLLSVGILDWTPMVFPLSHDRILGLYQGFFHLAGVMIALRYL